MSWLKPLIRLFLLGLLYPLSQFGWEQEEILQTVWAPIHVLWAFALGFGGLAIWRGDAALDGRRRATLGVLLLMGYGVSGLLWTVGGSTGGSPGGFRLWAAALWGGLVVAAAWGLSIRGMSDTRHPARA